MLICRVMPVRPVLDTLLVTSQLPQQLSLLRILKALIQSENEMKEVLIAHSTEGATLTALCATQFMSAKLVSCLLHFLSQQRSKEPSQISIVLHIIRSVIDFAVNHVASPIAFQSPHPHPPPQEVLDSPHVSAWSMHDRRHRSSSINSISSAQARPHPSTGSRYYSTAASALAEEDAHAHDPIDFNAKDPSLSLASRGLHLAANVMGELIR